MYAALLKTPHMNNELNHTLHSKALKNHRAVQLAKTFYPVWFGPRTCSTKCLCGKKKSKTQVRLKQGGRGQKDKIEKKKKKKQCMLFTNEFIAFKHISFIWNTHMLEFVEEATAYSKDYCGIA